MRVWKRQQRHTQLSKLRISCTDGLDKGGRTWDEERNCGVGQSNVVRGSLPRSEHPAGRLGYTLKLGLASQETLSKLLSAVVFWVNKKCLRERQSGNSEKCLSWMTNSRGGLASASFMSRTMRARP